MRKYQERFAGSASAFIPLAVTALGVWDERSLRWLRRFSDACAAATATPVGLAFSSLMTRLSVALWRGNSQMLLSGSMQASHTAFRSYSGLFKLFGNGGAFRVGANYRASSETGPRF